MSRKKTRFKKMYPKPVSMKVHPKFYEEVRKISDEWEKRGYRCSQARVTEYLLKKYKIK